MHPYLAPQKPGQNGKPVWYLQSYLNTSKTLNEWEDTPANNKRGKVPLWRRLGYYDRTNHSDIWLPTDARRRPLKPHEDQDRLKNLEHDLGVSSVYSVLAPIVLADGKEAMTKWDRSSDLYNTLRYDARFEMFGYTFFYEHERGNHPIIAPGKQTKQEYSLKSLNHKINNYVHHIRSHMADNPVMLMDFEICSGLTYEPEATAEWIADTKELVARHGMEHRILIASHRDVVGNKDGIEGEIHNELMGDPLGEVWHSPDGKLSLLNLP
jgi:hypothetical protein